MRRKRILFWPLLAVMLMSGTAHAAPGDPYVIYTANSFSSGAVILRTDPVSGALTEVSRNGPQGTLFRRPYDLAVEADGSLVVADLGVPNARDGAIIRVDPLTGVQSLVSSGGEFYDPAGIAVAPDGQLYVVDNRAPDNDGAVIKVDPQTGEQKLISVRSDLPGFDELDLPFGIGIESDGDLIVTNRVSGDQIPSNCQALGKVVRVDRLTGLQQELSNSGSIAWPLGVAVAPDGGILVPNECPRFGGIIRLDPLTGDQVEVTPNGDQDVLETPERIAFDPAGGLLVSDFNLGPDRDGGIVRVDPQGGGQTLVRAGDLFNHPLGIAAVVNRPPSAALRLDRTVVAAGRPVHLDASGSSDPEGIPLVFEWDLDGDGIFEAGSGGAARATRSFSSNGPVTMRVRVNDRHGARAVAEASVLVDGAIPVITGLRVGARVLGVGARASAGAAGRPRKGSRRRRLPGATTIRFNLSEPAAVRLSLQRAQRGRRSAPGQPCRRLARRGRRCIGWQEMRVLTHDGAAGANAVRLSARGLRPGRYRLVMTAEDQVGNLSAERRLQLRLVRLRSARRASDRP
jgi:DNA-binding beta-propeller fold protein YncE